MRVVVTGAANPTGQAIVDALLAEGHQVRLFGCPEAAAARWGDKVQWHAGRMITLGSIEPVLSEREVLVHAACLDAPSKDKMAHAMHIERGTLGCRYGAERELLDQFIHVAPADTKGPYAKLQATAIATAEATRKVPTTVIRATSPAQAAQDVLAAIAGGEHQGRYPGRESDAVAA